MKAHSACSFFLETGVDECVEQSNSGRGGEIHSAKGQVLYGPTDCCKDLSLSYPGPNKESLVGFPQSGGMFRPKGLLWLLG